MEGVRLPDFSECFRIIDGSCVADWDRVEAIVGMKMGDGNLHDCWTGAARTWVSRIAGEQEGDAGVFETESLIVMASLAGEGQVRLGRQLQEALGSILAYLGKVSECERWGKLAVLVFEDSASYCNYVAQFYPEDSIVPMSGGLCVNDGYTHIALFEDEWGDLISAFVHETTHAYLGHLPLPMWMDEAVAMRMESLVAGRPEYQWDRELFERHQAHWNEATLEQFRSGESWSIAGDSFELSYQLAETLWMKIETNLGAGPGEIQSLIGLATWNDGGEAALQEIFGIGLDDLFRSVLGDVF